jgi:hypothetical protein
LTSREKQLGTESLLLGWISADTFSVGPDVPIFHGPTPWRGPEKPDKYAPIQPPDGLLHTQTKEVQLSNL